MFVVSHGSFELLKDGDAQEKHLQYDMNFQLQLFEECHR